MLIRAVNRIRLRERQTKAQPKLGKSASSSNTLRTRLRHRLGRIAVSEVLKHPLRNHSCKMSQRSSKLRLALLLRRRTARSRQRHNWQLRLRTTILDRLALQRLRKLLAALGSRASGSNGRRRFVNSGRRTAYANTQTPARSPMAPTS